MQRLAASILVAEFTSSTDLFIARIADPVVYGYANVTAVSGGAWLTSTKPKAPLPAAQPSRRG